MKSPEWFVWKAPKSMNKSRKILADKPHCSGIILLGWLQKTFDTKGTDYMFFNGLFYSYDPFSLFKQPILSVIDFTQLFNSIDIAQPHLLFLSSSSSSHPLSLHLSMKSNDHVDPASTFTSIVYAVFCFLHFPLLIGNICTFLVYH